MYSSTKGKFLTCFFISCIEEKKSLGIRLEACKSHERFLPAWKKGGSLYGLEKIIKAEFDLLEIVIFAEEKITLELMQHQ
jgi:hypothetical protein